MTSDLRDRLIEVVAREAERRYPALGQASRTEVGVFVGVALAALSAPEVFDEMVEAAIDAYCAKGDDDGDEYGSRVYIPSLRAALRAALGVLGEDE